MEAERMHKTMRKSAVLKGAVAGIASIAMLITWIFLSR